MKKLNPFFTIRTVGLIVISLLHLTMTLAFDIPAVHVMFAAFYISFAAVIALCSFQASENQKKLIPIRVKK
jgi:hypothetical protein